MRYLTATRPLTTMTPARPRAEYDPVLDVGTYSLGSAGCSPSGSYCVHGTVGSKSYRETGPDPDIAPGNCP